MKISRFEDIEAWKKARVLMNRVYAVVKTAPYAQDKDLQRQMRRTSVSAMSNIAEGFDGGSDAEFRRFLRMAKRSATELQSHLYVALDQRYLAEKGFQELYDLTAEVQRLIGGFIRYLRGPKDPKDGRPGSGPSPRS
ncbi:MAG TPA: four helix bundle protein [Planctomycetota bacterium]|nr:four helix bundle protein [Planctomycetota bacterium]